MNSTFDVKPVGNIKEAVYFFEDAHKYMGIMPSGIYNNIGVNGKNLTITILSLNKSELTIRLLESIKTILRNFEGTVLIIDNHSEEKELKSISNYLKDFPFYSRIEVMDKNYGVAGGRNKAIPFIKTEWFMFIDNDMYFISNPLKEIKEVIATLGCMFLNLPFYNSTQTFVEGFAGHMYIGISDDYELTVGSGRAFENVPIKDDYPSFLGTFIYGGLSIHNLKEFIRLGMLDDNMFVGFEDLEFSIRVFNNGLKIGNLGVVSLVHDHKKPVNEAGNEYEKARHNYKHLYESAMYMQKKTGLKVWNPIVDEWIKQRGKDLGTEDSGYSIKHDDVITYNKAVRNNKGLPDILLVVDVENWAFHNISKQLVKHLSNYFNFTIFSMSVIKDDVLGLIMAAQNYDLIHFFWRSNMDVLYDYKINNLLSGMDYNDFISHYVSGLKITTCVYDHSLLDANSLKWLGSIFNKLTNGYYVSSKKLFDIYNGMDYIPRPKMIIEDGVDTSLFIPKNIERFDNISERKIVIGWVGNSKWGSGLGEDFKGYHSILFPAIEELKKENIPVVLLSADKNEKMIKQTDMPDYYSKIDILVCVSKFEGTPNPVLEAMSCGVPVISTDVGIVPQVFGSKQRRFILKNRSKSMLKSAIINFIKEPSLFKCISDENLDSIVSWDWEKKADLFTKFFNKILLA